MGARAKGQISQEELSRWRLIEEFEGRLERAAAVGKEPRTFSDPRRKLGQKDYLSLLLLGLFNPVVDSMRGLCAASRLQRVQEEICSAPVSLGSFSEAQAVVDPELLQRVFAELRPSSRGKTCRAPTSGWSRIGRSFWWLTAPCGGRCRGWRGHCGAISTAGRAHSGCI